MAVNSGIDVVEFAIELNFSNVFQIKNFAIGIRADDDVLILLWLVVAPFVS